MANNKVFIVQNNIFNNINYPKDLKGLSIEDLKLLSKELREFIIEEIANNPGHLAASLGTVELSIALHYVFNTPYDRLIWDVGHQAYAHKILTGRKDRFSTNRTYNGLSGFPTISESEYDAFGTGHSSTSISAALGMAVGSHLKGETDRQHIAVIGDGSLTGGMAFEGLNNAGVAKSNLLVILNDNGISIDQNSSALNNYLTKIATSNSYNILKDKIWNLFDSDSNYSKSSRNFLSRISNSIKSLFLKQANLFESLDFRYFGPIDGHNLNTLTKTLVDLKKINGPKLLHIITKKGKGLKVAEAKPTIYHAPPTKFNSKTGELIKCNTDFSLAPRYQDVFGKTIIELANKNDRIIGVSPAMLSGCSLHMMQKKMPDRVFDVGIAEQHAVTFSAGLAVDGMLPFCNIYSSFMQRAYDQIIHDVALQNLNVVMCLDRAGLVGQDGATHHGVFDLAYLRPIPNLTISSPINEAELRNLMYTAQLENKGPFVIRYPRGRAANAHWKTEFKELPIGKGNIIVEGDETLIISIGHIGNNAKIAIDRLKEEKDINIGLYNIIFLKPIDEDLLHRAFKNFKRIITLENGCKIGGLGSAVSEFAQIHNYKNQIITLGIPDRFITHGGIEDLEKECNIDTDSIYTLLEERG